MPKHNCDYSKTVMYKIVCNDLSITNCYIGHTTEFIKRKSQHKSACNTISNAKHNLNLYSFIRGNGGWNNWAMVEIEKWNCNDGNEARARERYWYELHNATLNSEIPNRSTAEYNKDIKEKKEIYNHEYYEKNKDKLKNEAHNYYLSVKDSQEFKDKQKERHDMYCSNNKDKLKISRAEYYNTNKEEIRETLSVKLDCACGSKYSKGHKSHHEKTKKHIDYINSLVV